MKEKIELIDLNISKILFENSLLFIDIYIKRIIIAVLDGLFVERTLK